MFVENTNAVSASAPCVWPHRLLVFTLAGESYAAPILKVREILGGAVPRVVPGWPRHMSGVIDINSETIPIVNLRACFGLPDAGAAAENGIILMQVNAPDHSVVPMGLAVDRVEEVVQIFPGELELNAGFGTQIEGAGIIGRVKTRGAVKILLDVERIARGAGLFTLPASIVPVRSACFEPAIS